MRGQLRPERRAIRVNAGMALYYHSRIGRAKSSGRAQESQESSLREVVIVRLFDVLKKARGGFAVRPLRE
jgi:hypothetical protein